ncbi:MAG: hypothetical protein IPG22_17330 [Acidobacteria bacterium]|nr:hypothetical protein [Acidobacteriota bacterium]
MKEAILADRQNLGRAFEKSFKGSDVNLHPSNLAENITKYATELRAYRVSSYLDQATNTPSQVWNQGWKAVDRDKAINSLLKSNKLYKLTPESREYKSIRRNRNEIEPSCLADFFRYDVIKVSGKTKKARQVVQAYWPSISVATLLGERERCR